MADSDMHKVEPALNHRPIPEPKITAAEVIAAVLSLIWLVATSAFFILAPHDGAETSFDSIRFVMILIAVFMPIAMIWVGATAWRASATMREESRRLQVAITAMRQSYLAQQSGGTAQVSVAKKLDELAAAQRKLEGTLAKLVASGAVSGTPPEDKLAMPLPEFAEDQARLELGTPSEQMAMPLSVADFVRAMNFPETAEDKEGFRALRRALTDRNVGLLIHAAQDTLTLLSQDGIYMDDLNPDRAKPEVWRKFAKGDRGAAIAPLAGVQDRASLALAAARMKQDPIFRDTVHHFLRKFDRTLAEFEQSATDEEMLALADTRTARAFMLMGKVTGTFD